MSEINFICLLSEGFCCSRRLFLTEEAFWKHIQEVHGVKVHSWLYRFNRATKPDGTPTSIVVKTREELDLLVNEMNSKNRKAEEEKQKSSGVKPLQQFQKFKLYSASKEQDLLEDGSSESAGSTGLAPEVGEFETTGISLAGQGGKVEPVKRAVRKRQPGVPRPCPKSKKPRINIEPIEDNSFNTNLISNTSNSILKRDREDCESFRSTLSLAGMSYYGEDGASNPVDKSDFGMPILDKYGS